MKKVIEGNEPHFLYNKWLNSVRVTLGLADERGGFLAISITLDRKTSFK